MIPLTLPVLFCHLQSEICRAERKTVCFLSSAFVPACLARHFSEAMCCLVFPRIVCFISQAIWLVSASNFAPVSPCTPPPPSFSQTYSHSHISPHWHAAFTLQTNQFCTRRNWNATVKCGRPTNVQAVTNAPGPLLSSSGGVATCLCVAAAYRRGGSRVSSSPTGQDPGLVSISSPDTPSCPLLLLCLIT